MTQLYDARGNRYIVCTPKTLRDRGIHIADNAAEAAQNRQQWAAEAVDAFCSWPQNTRPEGSKAHRSDGLLVGPFSDEEGFEDGGVAQARDAFDLLIINTDGTLAERSGNGLTIFAQYLTDAGYTDASASFELRVHHDRLNTATPVSTSVEPTAINSEQGFWLDLGTAQFGAAAVGALAYAVEPAPYKADVLSQVTRLAQIHPHWTASAFVRIGNPHCVTLVSEEAQLPTFEALHEQPLNQALTRIAFTKGALGDGEPCPAGVNLQWAWARSANEVVAQVFERGEGPTASSGTSASAVACAAWSAGLVQTGLVHVSMPGGTAPVRLALVEEELQVALFGVAKLLGN
jgi:diaminopimelate epimerase